MSAVRPTATAMTTHDATTIDAMVVPTPINANKYRVQWYQSSTKVTIDVMARGVADGDVSVAVVQDPDGPTEASQILVVTLEKGEVVIPIYLAGKVEPELVKVSGSRKLTHTG